MKTKFNTAIRTLATAVFIAGLATGCENKGNNVTDRPEIEPGTPAYMSISVSLPTKGNVNHAPGYAKAPDITEVGSDAENQVKEILLVLADNNNNYFLHSIAENKTTSANLNVTAKFDQTGIAKFYDANGNIKSDYKDGIRVFVFCNPTEHLKNHITTSTTGNSWTDLYYTNTDDPNSEFKRNASIWKAGQFLMSNYKIETRELPSQLSQWNQYNSESRAFNLSSNNNGAVDNYTDRGAIKVERSVARLDFKDGSGDSTPENTYKISQEDGKNFMNVQLVRMGLVNMSNSFYYLRHMAADNTGTAASPVTLLDLETDNFVMDVDAATKMNDPDIAQLHNMFEYPLFNNSGKIDDNTRTQWDNWRLNDVLNQTEDNSDYSKAGYHVWRYITENTIPAADKQVSAYSTGVVFKGKLLAGTDLATDNDLYKAISGTYDKTGDYDYEVSSKRYPILFMFQNQIYVGWENGIKKSTEYDDATQTALYRAVNEIPDGMAQAPQYYYNQLLTAIENNSGVTNALADFRKAATAAGFTLYQASEDEHEGTGYYFYYYYWIHHRNNNDNNTMGIMEFATVRNNVYKLAVTKISKIGYPRIQDNNPDPLDPEDPDETSERYITVEVEVLPWVVRENDIEF